MPTVKVTAIDEHGERHEETYRNAEVRYDSGVLRVITLIGAASVGYTRTISRPFQWVLEWEVTP